jgi:hypothetical protein
MMSLISENLITNSHQNNDQEHLQIPITKKTYLSEDQIEKQIYSNQSRVKLCDWKMILASTITLITFIFVPFSYHFMLYLERMKPITIQTAMKETWIRRNTTTFATQSPARMTTSFGKTNSCLKQILLPITFAKMSIFFYIRIGKVGQTLFQCRK